MNLPSGARVWEAVGSDLAWTPGEHLSATVVDLLNGANWQRSGKKTTPPKPIDRPGDKARRDAANERMRGRARAFRERVRARQREAG